MTNNTAIQRQAKSLLDMIPNVMADMNWSDHKSWEWLFATYGKRFVVTLMDHIQEKQIMATLLSVCGFSWTVNEFKAKTHSYKQKPNFNSEVFVLIFFTVTGRRDDTVCSIRFIQCSIHDIFCQQHQQFRVHGRSVPFGYPSGHI